MAVTLTLLSPENANGTAWTENSSDDSFWGVTDNVDTLVTAVTLIFKNLTTGVTSEVAFTFGSGIDLRTTPQFLKVNFNADLPNFAGPICGQQNPCTAQAFALFTDGSSLFSALVSFAIFREPCACTEISDVFTTIDGFPCVGVDGSIGIQGKLFECTCGSDGACSGIPSPFVNQTGAVQIGLQDPATGIFYDYIPGAGTDGTGTFSVAFGIKQLPAVVALIPANGSKTFNLRAFFAGNLTHQPSNIFSKSVTVSGQQIVTFPCPLGTLIKDTVFALVPPNTTVHTLQFGFTAGLVVGGVTLTLTDIANKITTTVHDAIVSSGTSTSPVTPLEIKVYAGPIISVPAFFGFIGIPTQAFNVVATAIGSPIAGLVILAVILIAIALVLFFIFLIWAAATDKLSTALTGLSVIAVAIAVTVVAGAGAAIYFSRQPRVRRLLA